MVAAVFGAVLTGLVALPARAGHCEYCNEGLPSGANVEPATMPADGVLVISLTDARDRVLPADWWSSVRVEVHDAQGNPVAGALEVLERVTPAIWRPASAWPEGLLMVTVYGDLDSDCAWEETFEVDVTPDLAAPAPPQIVVDEVYEVDVRDELENLVCCDGARPFEDSVPGILCPGYDAFDIRFHDGECTHIRAEGSVVVTARLDPSEPSRFAFLDHRSANDISKVSVRTQTAECFSFEVVDLVSGATDSVDYCVRENADRPLGTFQRPEIDDELAQRCEGPAYVCDGSWNQAENCEPWAEATETNEGCGCSTRSTANALLPLLLLGLGYQSSRKRRIRSRTR